MKKSRCENLRQRYKRIEIEKAKLQNFNFTPTDTQEDVVSGSMSEFPYAQTHIKVTGIGSIEYPRKKTEIYSKILSIRKDILEIEDFIDNVETDETTRNILQMIYVLGMTQEQVAGELGYEQPAISKKLAAFWEIHDEKVE